MVTPDYFAFFTTMATVEATLFGLIFVAISIAPESITVATAPLDRQIKATRSYIALLNPLIISLFAMIPQQRIGGVALSLSFLGLTTTLAMTVTSIQNANRSVRKLRGIFFILVSFFLYGDEGFAALRLMQSPADASAMYTLTNLLVAIAILGIISAWDLIGIRNFYLRDWIFSAIRRKRVSRSETNSAAVDIDNKKKGSE